MPITKSVFSKAGKRNHRVAVKLDTTTYHWRDKLKSLSVHFNSAINQERVVTQKVKGVRGYYFLLPEWVDEKGEVLMKYNIKANYR